MNRNGNNYSDMKLKDIRMKGTSYKPWAILVKKIVIWNWHDYENVVFGSAWSL